MNTHYTIAHAVYTGSTDSEGYPTEDDYADPVERPVFGWFSGDSQLSEDSEYTRRYVQSMTVLVPDTTPYSPRDKVILPGDDEWFVTASNDYNTGPFPYKPGGTVVIEQVIG